MKKILSLLTLMLLALKMSAGPCDALWQAYAKATKADQPKSAIAVLHKIQQTAESKKSYGDLLAALVREHNQWGEISEDSVKSYKTRLMAWQKKQKGVLYTLLQTVLYQEQGAPKVDSLLTSPDAAIYTKVNGGLTYKPFIEQGIDSKYFNNDLLSIIATHTEQYLPMQQYYASTKNRQSACVAAALCLQHECYGKASMQKADSLITVYGDLPECGAIAVRKAITFDKDNIGAWMAWIDEATKRWPSWKENANLQRMREELIQPQCNVTYPSTVTNTNTDIKLALEKCRNIKNMKVSMQHRDANGKVDKQQTIDHALPWKNEYSMMTDTINLGRLALGDWDITLTNDEGAKLEDTISLHITDLRVLGIGLPDNHIRYIVVNDITGQPVPGATLHVQEGNNFRFNMSKNAKPIQKFTVNGKGEYLYTQEKDGYTCVKATNADDYAMPGHRLLTGYGSASNEESLKHWARIFLDRAIYRPGQTVHFSAVSWNVKNDKETTVNKNDKITIKVRDTSRKEIKELMVVTDDFGTATGEFTIPTDCRTGRWTIYANDMGESFKVEEYKRPKFIVTIDKPTISYKAGDTISVRGTAKSYSGMAVSNAKVTYTIDRNNAWWWHSADNPMGRLLSDTVFTDADGTFTMRMPMVMPKESNRYTTLFYSIKATAKVTDTNGESHTEVLSLPLSNRDSYLSLGMKDKVLADSVISVTFKRVNPAGKDIDGTVKVTIDGVAQADAKANQKYTMAKSIASGKHTIMGICEGDTVKSEFVAFHKSDATPVTFTHKWDYASAQEWKNANDKVWLQVGSSDKDVRIFYNILANNAVIEQGDTTLSGSNITRTFAYKPEYGNGIRVVYAWVKDGKTYIGEHEILRALPDKKLKLEWSSFRNKLVPGQKEQWSVRIKNPDGTPAKAQMMAVLYDKSLEQLAKLSWIFPDYRSNRICATGWCTITEDWLYRHMAKEMKPFANKGFDFSKISVNLESGRFGRWYSSQRQMMMKSAPDQVMSSKAAIGHYDVNAMSGMSIGGAETEDPTSVRNDFSETAFWLPQLIADNNGIATLCFTMPESVTSWKFRAFAHDKDMRYGFLDDEAVTQKQLMIEPNMPRFLRLNDKATISANIGNLSDKVQDIKVTMTVLNPSTEKPLHSIYNNVRVEAGKSASVTFPLDVKAILGKDAETMKDTTFIVRWSAAGKGFSDGEQHLLPVLTGKEAPIDTATFVVDPKKMIEEALPELKVPTSNNAITLSNACYANVMAAHLNNNAAVSPANDNVLAQLINLQKADGGFAWYGGMESSKYMTVAVLKTLARVNAICGVQHNTEFMMSKAFTYVEKKMVEEMKFQEEHKQQYLSGTTLDWLYALTLTGKDGGSAEKYFRKMLYDETRKDDMQSKAVAGIVLNNDRQAKKAQEFAEAIKQHTVYRPDMGRYFDSYRAEYSWCDYKIPTQSMCIEALNDITPADTTTITEMQRWLVQSKRTQRWDNAINAVNAIYALSLSSAQKPFMAKYTANPADYKDCIKVTREIIPSSNLQHVTDYNVGDKVTVRLTIVADRDYDFVTVTDNRAACLEPTQQLSGYRWTSGGGYYQEMKDRKAVYHLNQCSKGTHVIETEYYIDRKGNYTSGKATAVCEYAPEFRGITDSYDIEIK